jgi:outer membrane protein assembly factor BamA
MFFCLRRVRSHIVVLVTLAILAGVLGPAAVLAEVAPKVVSVSVSGNVHVPTDKILAVVKTKVGQPFNEEIVREDLAAINDLGFFADQVPPLIRQRPDGVSVTYRVIENPIITKITFSGNEHVPSDTLLALMDTAPGQVLNTNTFHQDVLKINSYYDKIGYGGQVPTHVRDLNIDPATGVLHIDIREGLTVKTVKVNGDYILPQPLILKALALKPGMPYSEETRDKDVEAVKALYEKYDLEVGNFEAGIDPGSVDLKAGTADVLYTIDVARVGAVQITGNDVTKDIVVRRQLRLRPGMIVTQAGLKRDYERLNNLGFFSKVELNTKPGPNPKKPAELTLDWNVTEQRTGTAQIGAGYSGGLTGTGLTGNLSYSQNNINGTGNGASVNFQRGARLSSATASISVPYLGDTPKTEKYSLSGSIYSQAQTNYLPIYATNGALLSVPPVIGTPGPTGPQAASGTIPVVLVPNSNEISGVVSTSDAHSTGASATIGRRLSDSLTGTLGLSVARIGNDVSVPTPYFINGSQPSQFYNSPQTSVFGTSATNNTLGIEATSIANIPNGSSYKLRSTSIAALDDTLDDVFNPRHGVKVSLTEQVSLPFLGSNFNYTITTLDAAKFYPLLKTSTIGFHAVLGDTTGAIPPNQLFVLTDQQLRGYNSVFYGTEEVLLQTEFRYPLTADRKLTFDIFGDYGNLRIKGAQPIYDAFGNVVANYNQWIYHGDAGVGITFDLPQLGFRSVRIDFARGAAGTHTSFGIGQSF